MRLFVELEMKLESGNRKGIINRFFSGSKPNQIPENPPRKPEELDVEISDPIQENIGSDWNNSITTANSEGPVNSTVVDSETGTESDTTGEPSSVQAMESGKSQSWLQRMRSGLSRSSSTITDGLTNILTKRKLNEELLEELEDVLIKADLGVETATAVTDNLAKARFDKEITNEEVREVLATEVESVLNPLAQPLEIDSNMNPFVILVVGVNGTGKTTTIGKLASKFRSSGKTVDLVAGDTFRAAAVEQLKVWGERTGSPVHARENGGDAASLVFDAMQTAKENGRNVILIDTAGRLQNKSDLMQELSKIIRVIKKQDESAPHCTLLTLDATTGQNALMQVEVFGQVAKVNGLVMTKLDGTARGGILVAIARKFSIPIHFIGIGEKVDDLESFSAKEFSRAIAGLSE